MRNCLRLVLLFLTIFSAIPVNLSVAAGKRPLVVLPGILGSQLEKQGEVIWGDIGSLENFSSLRVIDGPKQPNDGVEATQLIGSVQLFGFTIVEQYDPLLDHLTKSLGYTHGKTLFVWPYDWRQSNFISAGKLEAFISKHPILKTGDFDILAHSMGGLIAKILIQKHPSGNRVSKLITLGTPFYGSMSPLSTLVEGWGSFKNQISGGMNTIRSTVLSFPAIYEVLPRYNLCCIWGAENEDKRLPFDMLSQDFWKQTVLVDRNLLSDTGINRALSEAAKLNVIVAQPFPSKMKVYTFAGRQHATKFQVYFNANASNSDNAILSWRLTDGDGTVSSANAALGALDTAPLSFSPHATIFDDPYVKKKLSDVLSSDGKIGPDDFGGELALISTTTGKLLKFEQVMISTDGTYIGTNKPINVSLSFIGAQQVETNDEIAIAATIGGGTITRPAKLTSTGAINVYDHEQGKMVSKIIHHFTVALPAQTAIGILKVSAPAISRGKVQIYVRIL